MGLSSLLFTSRSWAGKRFVVERIVAVVNGDIVLWSDWKQKYEALQEKILQGILDNETKKKRAAALRDEVLQRMIDDILLDQVALKLQIGVAKQEIDAAVEDTRKRYKLTAEQFLEAQKQQGFTASSYREMVQRELRKLRLLQRVLRDKVNVTSQDEQAFYRQMIQGVEAGPAEVLVRHIQWNIPSDATPAQIQTLKQRADSLFALVQKALQTKPPAKFEVLAKKYSQEANASETGGSLGWHKLKFDVGEEETLPPSLMQAVRKTKPGEIYPKVIRSQLGFHMLYVEQHRLSGVLSFKEALPNIRKVLRQRAFERAYQQYILELRKKAVVERRL